MSSWQQFLHLEAGVLCHFVHCCQPERHLAAKYELMVCCLWCFADQNHPLITDCCNINNTVTVTVSAADMTGMHGTDTGEPAWRKSRTVLRSLPVWWHWQMKIQWDQAVGWGQWFEFHLVLETAGWVSGKAPTAHKKTVPLIPNGSLWENEGNWLNQVHLANGC